MLGNTNKTDLCWHIAIPPIDLFMANITRILLSMFALESQTVEYFTAEEEGERFKVISTATGVECWRAI